MVQEPGDFDFFGIWVVGAIGTGSLSLLVPCLFRVFCEWCVGDQLVFIRGGVYYIYMSCNGLFLWER